MLFKHSVFKVYSGALSFMQLVCNQSLLGANSFDWTETGKVFLAVVVASRFPGFPLLDLHLLSYTPSRPTASLEEKHLWTTIFTEEHQNSIKSEERGFKIIKMINVVGLKCYADDAQFSLWDVYPMNQLEEVMLFLWLEWNISVSSCILSRSLLMCNRGCCFLLRAAVQSDSWVLPDDPKFFDSMKIFELFSSWAFL